jgi:hypothetical protein
MSIVPPRASTGSGLDRDRRARWRQPHRSAGWRGLQSLGSTLAGSRVVHHHSCGRRRRNGSARRALGDGLVVARSKTHSHRDASGCSGVPRRTFVLVAVAGVLLVFLVVRSWTVRKLARSKGAKLAATVVLAVVIALGIVALLTDIRKVLSQPTQLGRTAGISRQNYRPRAPRRRSRAPSESPPIITGAASDTAGSRTRSIGILTPVACCRERSSLRTAQPSEPIRDARASLNIGSKRPLRSGPRRSE